MGVPDFLKFAARTSPAALCRIPKGLNAAPLFFDFVIIDATNVHQTLGFEVLADFIKRLRVRKAVIFAMDAQRDRAGTARSHRTHATVASADVAVQELCMKLQQFYKQRNDTTIPQVLMSGRHVAGEADYKILDIHRHLLAHTLASSTVTLPTFLFVSEDSDVLCGALCGPAPQTVSIATRLHDTMFEVCVLRLTHVLAYVAFCVDALAGNEAPLEVNASSKEAYKAEKNSNTMEKEMEVDRDSKEEEKVLSIPTAFPSIPEESIVRRKKQDGPMVATGTRIVLSDSDSEDGIEKKGGKGKRGMITPETLAKEKKEHPIHKGNIQQTAQVNLLSAHVTEHEISVAEILQNSCVDLVFLFIVIMGNGSHVPPVVRGATKVDIHSCWKMYCRMKYNTAENGHEKLMGRNLLCLHDTIRRGEQQSYEFGSIAVDCSFLRTILEAAHYADAQSRPPVEEEKERALRFLAHAVYATLRYVVACNIHIDLAADETFLDARPLMETEVVAPSLSAFLWVLSQSKRRTLTFPLIGLATEEVLAHAALGSKAVVAAMTAARAERGATNRNIELLGSVGNTLVEAGCRSGVPQTVPLHRLMVGNKTVNGQPRSVIAYLADCVEKVMTNSKSIPCVAKEALLSQIFLVWQRTLAVCLPELGSIVQSGQFVSPLTGTTMNGEEALTNVKNGNMGNTTTTVARDVKLTYSFELRRMAPVLAREGGEEDNHLIGKTKTDNDNDKNNENSDGNSGDAKSTLLRALRVSYDYAQPPPPPTNVVSYVTPSGKKKRDGETVNTEGGNKHSRANEATLNNNHVTTDIVAADGAEPAKKKYRRLGKKERQKLKNSKTTYGE